MSCRDFRDNEVRRQVFALAYNLGIFLQTLALPCKVSQVFPVGGRRERVSAKS